MSCLSQASRICSCCVRSKLLLQSIATGSVARPGELGAVFRTVLETMRTMFVWLVDLLLFYTPLGLGKLGESWSVYSFIQAGGWAPSPVFFHCMTFAYARACLTKAISPSVLCLSSHLWQVRSMVLLHDTHHSSDD